MATYANDLRLKEIASGDEDGTWGTSTNANLSLIADAFGLGAKQLAADANETFTMPDATADGTRALYLKITSAVSLSATRTVTLAPNTVSKVWIIENATTGGQIITIRQGSGATVNVPNGSKVVVVTDGAGAGAAVFNANPTETEGVASVQVLREELADGEHPDLLGFKQSGTGAIVRTVESKLRDFVNVKDFGAVGDGVTDDTLAFTRAAAASRFVFVPRSPSGYNVSKSVSIGSSMFFVMGSFAASQFVGTATIYDLNAVSMNAGNMRLNRLRLDPPKNTLTGSNEGEKRGIFIQQAEPDLSSTDYGDGQWHFNSISTEWKGKRTGSGIAGGGDSATVTGLHSHMKVGGPQFDIQSAAALGSGLTHTEDDTCNADKLGFNTGVYTNAVSPGKIYGSSSAFTIDSLGSTPQAIGHEVDVFIETGGSTPYGIGFHSWSGGTEQATDVYSAYGIGRSGASGSAPWKTGFMLYTKGGETSQPISTTGSLFGVDHNATLKSIFDFSTVNVTGHILDFPNVEITGPGTVKVAQGYDFSKTTPPSPNSTKKLLVDYEEGMMITALTPSDFGSIEMDAVSNNRISYTKIGNIVHVRGQLTVKSVTDPAGYVKINMPFTCADFPQTAGASAGSVSVSNSVSKQVKDFVISIAEGDNFARLHCADANSPTGDSGGQMKAGVIIRFGLSYPASTA